MSGFDDPTGFDYAFDGMSLNIDSIISDDDLEKEAIEKEKKNGEILARKKRLTALISGHASTEEIREHVLKILLNASRNYMVKRYAAREGLSDSHVQAAKDANGLLILIKSALKSTLQVELQASLMDEVQRLVKSLHENKDKKIIYDRVGIIQKFVHSVADEKSKIYSSSELPRDFMGDFLSACRLHLNLFDLDNSDISLLIEQDKLNSVEIKKEKARGREITVLPGGKKHIPYWKVRHLRPIMAFNKEGYRKIYKEVCKISLAEDRINYIDKIVTTLLNNNTDESIVKQIEAGE